MTKLCFVALVLAGCTSKPPGPTDTSAVATPAPKPTPPPATTPPPPTTTPAEPTPAATTKLGDDCSKGQNCTAPATCVSYLGIAGARGPTFKTCEIKCSAKSACPTGTTCARIADGPGEVCR